MNVNGMRNEKREFNKTNNYKAARLHLNTLYFSISIFYAQLV